jgi:hypothetical protein
MKGLKEAVAVASGGAILKFAHNYSMDAEATKSPMWQW